MSRTTTDDCREHCPNHFNLAYHVAERAHQILRQGDERVSTAGDKPVVLSLREIAKGLHVVAPLASETPTDSATDDA